MKNLNLFLQNAYKLSCTLFKDSSANSVVPVLTEYLSVV